MSEEEHAEETANAQVEQPADFEESETEVQVVSEDEEQDSQEQLDSPGKPALVINVHSWATPIAGLVMLVVGLLVGYLIHPLISPPSQAETPVAVAPANTPASEAQAPAATQPPASLEEVMSYLMTQVRHTKGDPEAAVTLIEFSDFQ